MKKNAIIKTIWIWLDTESGDCFETHSLNEMKVKIGYDNKKDMSFNELINSKKFIDSPYRFWAQAEILNN